MDAQIIAVIGAAVVGTGITVGASLGLALLNGFRRLHDKIDETARENRKDNAAHAKDLRAAIAKNGDAIAKNGEAIAKNTEAISGIRDRMALVENLLNAVLRAVISNRAQTSTAADTPVDATASQTETERTARPAADARTAAAAIAPATGL